MSAGEASTVAQILVAGGVGTVAAELTRRWRSPRLVKLDVAARVQEAALGLIAPLEKRAETAEAKCDLLASKLGDLEIVLEEVISWARMAKRELDARHIQLPPIPTPREANGSHP